MVGAEVRLTVSAVDRVELAAAADVLGPPENLVAACAMGLGGPLGGRMILVFQDRAGLALVDLLLNQPVGTTTTWGDIERSAAMETTNIVGCAYLNALASHLPSNLRTGADAELTPSPPVFFHEFAGSLLEFALMDQALELDEVLLVRSAFAPPDRPGPRLDAPGRPRPTVAPGPDGLTLLLTRLKEGGRP